MAIPVNGAATAFHSTPHAPVVIVGGGPAGLMAAEVLLAAGLPVSLFDAMPSLGRKLLMAGKGGLNITHSEPESAFLSRYGERRDALTPSLAAFSPAGLRKWMAGLGIDSFVGSSGRVFPVDMKAAPLLRAWLHRLRGDGLEIHVRHRWQGFAGGNPVFASPAGPFEQPARAVVLALGGGSWPQLGSNGAWVPLLQQAGVAVAALKPANCGFDVGWSPHFIERFAGEPVKPVAASLDGAEWRAGEFVVTASGIEGGLVYSLSRPLRERIEDSGSATLFLNLLPQWKATRVRAEVGHPRGSRSLASHLASRLGIRGVKAGLLHECLPKDALADPDRLAAALQSLPLTLTAPRPLAEAISSAGGVDFSGLDNHLMLRALPGVFCAGEMLDWEAPTGGYLLTACLATGRAAGHGLAQWLRG